MTGRPATTPDPAADEPPDPTPHSARVAALLDAQREAIRKAVDDAPPVPPDVANRLRTLFGRVQLPTESPSLATTPPVDQESLSPTER